MEYLSSRIASANEAELVAIMYEGFIKKCESCIESIEIDDKKSLNESIIKSRHIIAELLATLKGDSEIASNYRSIYMYLNQLLTFASISKDITKLEEAIKIVTPLYEGWSELGKKIFNENIEKGKDVGVVSGMTYGKGYLNDDTATNGNIFEA